MEHHYRKYVDMLREKTGGQKSSRSGLRPDPVKNASPQQHYSVMNKDRDHVNLYELSVQHMGDPALKVSSTALQRFLQH